MPENDRVAEPSAEEPSSEKPLENEATSNKTPVDLVLPRPRVEIVVNGNTIQKPGMKSYFMDEVGSATVSTKQVLGSEGYVVGGTICTCNKVLIDNETGETSTCASYNKSSSSGRKGGSSGGGCSCNKICTCVPVT